MRAKFLGVMVLLLSTSARADMVADGQKGVKLSIAVEAEVPAGKLLVLANTFRGADIVTPGSVQQVEWHPMGGAMQLRVTDKDRAAAIEAGRENIDRDKVLAQIKAGPACGEAFQGVRTIDDTLLADEIRWHFKVSITGKTCSATLVRTDYLDKDGKVVDAKATAPTAADMREPAPPAPAPAPPPAPVAAPPAPAPAPVTPPPASSGCHVAGDTSLAGLFAGLLLLLLRRRRPR